MRRIASRWLVALLVWALLPGAAEAAENLLHLLSRGHLAHSAEAGDHHREPDPEHGCSGTFHLCSCHASPAFLAIAPAAVPLPAPPRERPAAATPTSLLAGVDSCPDRPPCIWSELR